MKQCPQCFRRFPPDLFFCPHDGTPLRVPTGRLEAAGATGTLPRIPWENDPEQAERAEAALESVDRAAAEAPVFARSTEPLPSPVKTVFYDGPAGRDGDGVTEPFEPIPETGPIQPRAEIQKTEPHPVFAETAPPTPPTDFRNSTPAFIAPPVPPEIPMMAPAYGGPPGRRFADFGTLQPSLVQRFGLPVGFFAVGSVVGAAVGSGLMAVAKAGPKFALMGGAVVGLLLGVACAFIGGLLARRG